MSEPRTLDLPSGRLSLDRVQIMGILNVTPDSFYDRGRYYGSLDRSLARASEMVAEGAGIIDVGGEKAGPGEPVAAIEEIRRVVPVIEAVKSTLRVSVSVDTFKPEVARAAVDAGADIINSIDGFRNPEMRRVAAETGAVAVIMHIRGTPRVANPSPHYDDVVSEVRAFLETLTQLCRTDGIPGDRIVIDPGPGFGKTAGQDLEVLRHLERLTELPYPVLLAASRKTFIGEVLGVGPDDRLDGSLAVAAWAVLKGARIIRTHDVQATVRTCRMTEAVLRPELVEVGA